MKLDRLNYLELVVHHKDFTLYEYPARYCVIRVSLTRFDNGSLFSVGQLRKLISIGLSQSNVEDYLFVPHRHFDQSFCLEKFPDCCALFSKVFRVYFIQSFRCFDDLLNK